jgi:hypothetical protein
MRNTLTDVIRQAGSLFEVVKVTGTENSTVFEAADENKTLFFKSTVAVAIPEFEGEFGLTNLGLLLGLLNFPSYNTDKATFEVQRRKLKDVEFVEAFIFRDAKNKGTEFRTMNSELVKGQAKIANIPWDVTFEPNSGNLEEFAKLSSLLSGVDKNFGVRTVEGNLEFSVGGSNSATHRGNMIFQENVSGEIKGEVQFNTQQFIAIMKLAGKNPTRLSITGKGVLGVQVNTQHGIYDYYLRANRA